MKKLIPFKIAAQGTLILLSLIIVFHLLIITGVIPYDMVWGGRLQSEKQMRQFEMVSILLNAFMWMVVAIKAGYLKWMVHSVALKIVLWLMVVIFALNTIGNLMSLNSLEAIIFTPVTLILAVFSLRLAMD